MATNYAVGSEVRFSVAFTDLNNNPADPSAITFKLKNPLGVISTYTYGASAMVRDGVGLYHIDLQVTLSGSWSYRYEGTGSIIAADETQITVKQTVF